MAITFPLKQLQINNSIAGILKTSIFVILKTVRGKENPILLRYMRFTITAKNKIKATYTTLSSEWDRVKMLTKE
jgi:hypothetical protein